MNEYEERKHVRFVKLVQITPSAVCCMNQLASSSAPNTTQLQSGRRGRCWAHFATARQRLCLFEKHLLGSDSIRNLVTVDFVFESDRKRLAVHAQCFFSSLVPCSQ
jgi:hypothetical protein